MTTLLLMEPVSEVSTVAYSLWLPLVADKHPVLLITDYLHVMDLANGHINALDAIENDDRFKNLP